MSKKVLLVDNDPLTRDQCIHALREFGCEVSVSSTAAGALAQVGAREFDAVLIDVRLAGLDGSDLPRAMKARNPRIAVVALVQETASPHSLQFGGYPLLTKPLATEKLACVLEPSPQQDATPPVEAAASAAPPAQPGFAGLIGTSDRIKKVHRLISKVALQRHPVLITGESGTGKELVARAIHNLGPWREQPFVPVDCGALPPTLIESELFGHVKGAFTGATQSRRGLLATAGTGTVFLDEIGELPIELQSRLLRALQEHEVRPLGSNECVRFDARIVAATNQDLGEAIKRGAFRQDLYFRLNVVSIRMPPLRDRKEDIPILVRHFIERYGAGNAAPQMSDEVMGRLMNYDWPGNVRELENCIQRAISLGSGTFVQMQDLPSSLLYHLGQTPSAAEDLTTLQALEQQAIRQALQATGGDRIRAAKLLGIGKTTIYRKLKEYGMEESAAEA
jgi:two-component system response regulator HydG